MLRTHSLSLTLVFAALTLAACDEPGAQQAGPAPAAFVDADATQIAAGIAADVNSLAGRNIGGGLQYRGATSEGDRVRIELKIPIAANGITSDEKRRASSGVRGSLRRGTCRQAADAALLAAGGEVEIALYGRDNGFIDDFVFDTPCS